MKTIIQLQQTIDLYYSLGQPEYLKQKKDEAKKQIEEIKQPGYFNGSTKSVEVKIKTGR